MKEKMETKIIIDKYSEMIYHIALRYMNTKEDAEDILQEVFLKYIRYVKDGKSFNTEEHEKCWLIRVTMNLCCNEICSAKRKKLVPLKENLYYKLEVGSENLLIEAIGRLKCKYREVFELFYIDDLKISEISKVLNISEANVKTRLKRARNAVKEFIRKGERYYERI